MSSLIRWTFWFALAVLCGGTGLAADAGQALFATACGACHGTSGEGGRGPNIADGRLVRRLTDEEMFRSIQKGVPGTEMAAFPFPDEQIRQLVAYLRSLNAPAFDTNVPGDPEAGAALFYGKAGCTGCHTIAGRGGLLGPDLTNIGLQRPLRRLREAVLDPSARLTDGFAAVTVTATDGRRISGVAKNYTNYSIQVLDAQGGLHLLRQTEWRGVEFGRESPMPGDYARRLSGTEIDNLIAFLSRQAAARRN